LFTCETKSRPKLYVGHLLITKLKIMNDRTLKSAIVVTVVVWIGFIVSVIIGVI